MTNKEQKQLFKLMHNTKDKQEKKEIKDKIIMNNLGLVVSVASSKKYSLFNIEDLVSAGNEGLITGIEKYDYRKGFKFSTFVRHEIKNAINNHITKKERLIRLPHNVIVERRKIKRAINQLSEESVINPTNEEISKHLNGEITPERVGKVRIYSLDYKKLDERLHKDEIIKTPYQHSRGEEISKAIQELAEKHLTPKQLKVFKHSEGLFDLPSMSVEEIAKEMEITKEEVKTLKYTSIRKLKSKSKELEYLK